MGQPGGMLSVTAGLPAVDRLTLETVHTRDRIGSAHGLNRHPVRTARRAARKQQTDGVGEFVRAVHAHRAVRAGHPIGLGGINFIQVEGNRGHLARSVDLDGPPEWSDLKGRQQKHSQQSLQRAIRASLAKKFLFMPSSFVRHHFLLLMQHLRLNDRSNTGLIALNTRNCNK